MCYRVMSCIPTAKPACLLKKVLLVLLSKIRPMGSTADLKPLFAGDAIYKCQKKVSGNRAFLSDQFPKRISILNALQISALLRI